MELRAPAAKKNTMPGLWTSIGVIGATIAAASAVLYFLYGNLDAEASRIVANKTALANQTEAVTILAHLESDAAKAAPYETAMQQLLPTHDALIGFPQWVQGIGTAHHVSVIASFQGGAMAATPSTPGVDNFTFQANGSFTDLAAFLLDVEGNAPGFLVSVDSMEFINQGSQFQLKGNGRVFSRASS